MSSDNYFVKEADNYYRRKLNTYQYTINSNKASGPNNNPGQFEFDIPPFPFPTHQQSKLAIFRLTGFQVINQGNVDAQRVSQTIDNDLSGFYVRLSGLGTRGQLLNNQETNTPAKLLPKPEFFVLNKYADVLEGTGIHEARQQLQVHSGSDDDLDAVADVIWNDWGGEKRKKDGIIYRTLRGPTKDWHETIDYIKKPLSFDRDKFELVLVDGRARPMCAFMATKLMDRDSYLLFHDFGNRPYYYGVLRYFKPIERAGSLVVFKLRDNPVSNEEILKKYNTRAIGWAEKRKKLSTDFMCKLTEHTYLEMEKELEGDK